MHFYFFMIIQSFHGIAFYKKKKNYFGGCHRCKEEGFSLKKQNAFYKL